MGDYDGIQLVSFTANHLHSNTLFDCPMGTIEQQSSTKSAELSSYLLVKSRRFLHFLDLFWQHWGGFYTRIFSSIPLFRLQHDFYFHDAFIKKNGLAQK